MSNHSVTSSVLALASNVTVESDLQAITLRTLSIVWLCASLGVIIVAVLGLVALFIKWTCCATWQEAADRRLFRALHADRIKYQSGEYPSTTPLPIIQNQVLLAWLLFLFRWASAVYLAILVVGGIGISQSNEASWEWLLTNTAVVYFIYNSYWTLVLTMLYFALVALVTALDLRTYLKGGSGVGHMPRDSYHDSVYSLHWRSKVELLVWWMLELVASAQLVISSAYWIAILVTQLKIVDYPYETSFIQGSAHGAGLILITIEMLLGSRRWVFSHIWVVLHYVTTWMISCYFLYLATGQVVYAVQDVQSVAPTVAYLFYPVFVVYYCVGFSIMYGIDKLFGKLTASVTGKRVTN